MERCWRCGYAMVRRARWCGVDQVVGRVRGSKERQRPAEMGCLPPVVSTSGELLRRVLLLLLLRPKALAMGRLAVLARGRRQRSRSGVGGPGEVGTWATVGGGLLPLVCEQPMRPSAVPCSTSSARRPGAASPTQTAASCPKDYCSATCQLRFSLGHAALSQAQSRQTRTASASATGC